jgi:ABC-type Mn2+/Zn2+ transport system permease subunit
VVSMLTGPAATATLFSKSLIRMIYLAVIIFIGSCILAYAIAACLKASIAGCLAAPD